jgi:hypothetical protein
MPASRPNGRRRVERRNRNEPRRRIERSQARSARRARRFALLALLAAVFVVALALVAFGGHGSGIPEQIRPTALPLAQLRPSPEIVALRGPVQLQLPISQAFVTAIGYSAASDALSLTPYGHQANEGLVARVAHGIFGGGGGNPAWYQLGGGGTNSLDVGALPGTEVYAPVDGTVAAIRPFIVMGKQYGSEIDIQPQSAPSLVVAVSQLSADPALTVGSAVVSGATKLGTVVDLAGVEQQALAKYTNDGGNHVTIEVRAAPVVTAS